ncbi:unnamed protein product [Jaminaea pallidilutea]
MSSFFDSLNFPSSSQCLTPSQRSKAELEAASPRVFWKDVPLWPSQSVEAVKELAQRHKEEEKLQRGSGEGSGQDGRCKGGKGDEGGWWIVSSPPNLGAAAEATTRSALENNGGHGVAADGGTASSSSLSLRPLRSGRRLKAPRPPSKSSSAFRRHLSSSAAFTHADPSSASSSSPSSSSTSMMALAKSRGLGLDSDSSYGVSPLSPIPGSSESNAGETSAETHRVGESSSKVQRLLADLSIQFQRSGQEDDSMDAEDERTNGDMLAKGIQEEGAKILGMTSEQWSSVVTPHKPAHGQETTRKETSERRRNKLQSERSPSSSWERTATFPPTGSPSSKSATVDRRHPLAPSPKTKDQRLLREQEREQQTLARVFEEAQEADGGDESFAFDVDDAILSQIPIPNVGEQKNRLAIPEQDSNTTRSAESAGAEAKSTRSDSSSTVTPSMTARRSSRVHEQQVKDSAKSSQPRQQVSPPTATKAALPPMRSSPFGRSRSEAETQSSSASLKRRGDDDERNRSEAEPERMVRARTSSRSPTKRIGQRLLNPGPGSGGGGSVSGPFSKSTAATAGPNQSASRTSRSSSLVSGSQRSVCRPAGLSRPSPSQNQQSRQAQFQPPSMTTTTRTTTSKTSKPSSALCSADDLEGRAADGAATTASASEDESFSGLDLEMNEVDEIEEVMKACGY